MASSMAACLHSVGVDMPHVFDVVPFLDADNVVEALKYQVAGCWGWCFVLSPYT